MKMIASTRVIALTAVVMLAVPAAALAQSPPTPAPAPASSPQARVEAHIKDMHARLRITPDEEPQWDQFAQVMRDNARGMDQEFRQRTQQYASMTALEDLQSYEKLAEAHVQRLQKLIPAFEALYNTMPPEQRNLADQVFRANAEQRAQMHAGRNRPSH